MLTSSCLAVLVLLLYGRILGHDFVNIDDHTYVVKNPHLADGPSGAALAWCFNAGYASNWHPLTWMSHLLDVTLFGLAAWGHHLGNLLLHASSSVLVFLVFLRMTATAGTHAARGASLASLFVALVFAVHPQHVESVAWAAERKDALSTFLWLLTMLAYLRYAERPGIGRYLVVSLALVLGLMAKPMLVTLPFALLLLDVWPLRRIRFASPADPGGWRQVGQRLLEKAPWFALIAGSSVLTMIAQSRGGAVGSLEALTIPARLANSSAAVWTYVVQFVWPWPMAVFYPMPGAGPATGAVVAGALLVIAGSALAVTQVSRRPWIPVGWLWFLGTLVPVIGLVQVGEQSHADRYTYVPHLGLAMLLAFSATAGGRGGAGARKVVAAVAVGFLLAWTSMTFVQVGTWKNSETLFQHAIAVTEANHKAHNNLGAYLADQGRLDQAGEHFRLAVQAHPGHPESVINQGKYLARTDRGEQARQLWERHLVAYPADLRVRGELARFLYEGDELAAATEHFQVLSDADPEDAERAYALGACRLENAEFQRAYDAFGRAAARGFEAARANRLMGFCAHRLGRVPAAIRHYRTALDLNPDEQQAAFNLGILYEQQRQLDDAESAFRHALTLNPRWFEARLALGNLQWSRQDPEAIATLEQAVALDPNRPEGRYALGRAYHGAGNSQKAVGELQALRQLDPDGARRLEELYRQ